MSHTFDIRFDRSGGLAALLEAPTNSFRWKGNGRLVIDTHGVSVAVKRGFLSLLSRNRIRRIPSAGLSQVFREGDALRLEFATDGAARASLLFWARDRDTAAQIVRLMPTSRTVEIEDNTGKRHFRFNWRVILLFGVALVTTTYGAFALRVHRTTEPAGKTGLLAPVSATDAPRSDKAEAPAVGSTPSATTAPPKLPSADVPLWRPARAREVVIAVYPNRPAPSLQPLETFDPVAAEVPEVLASAATAGTTDSTTMASLPIIFTVNVSPDGVVPLVAGMVGYEAARREIEIFRAESERGMWWEMTARIHNDPVFADPALWPLRDAELAASRAARTLDGAFARLLTARVLQYVD